MAIERKNALLETTVKAFRECSRRVGEWENLDYLDDHKFKTPLAPIFGYFELLKEQFPGFINDEIVREHLRIKQKFNAIPTNRLIPSHEVSQFRVEVLDHINLLLGILENNHAR